MASSVRSTVSVGEAYGQGSVYSVDHPLYRAFSDAVAERVQDAGIVRGLSKASARAVPLGIALLPEEAVMLSESYPEFNIVSVARSRPGHPYWVAYRRLANEWLMEHAEKLSKKVAHLGGSLASYLAVGAGAEVSLLYDLSDPVVVQEKYSTIAEAHSLFADYGQVSRSLGRALDHTVYEQYLGRRGIAMCSNVEKLPEADVLLVDLSLYGYSPMQVASMMRQSGSSVALGFFVYHPSMLLASEGEIGNTGVFFRRSEGRVHLRYSDGAAGVVEYKDRVWSSWLTAHSFPMGTGKGALWYQIELLNLRGHLMFFRMTKLDAKPRVVEVMHALDVGSSDSYAVTSWQLRRFGADPGRRDSWEPRLVVAPRRVVDRVYQFAMQLPRDQFTRYAIRKQISVVNDRVTVEGTMVRVNKPLPVDVVDALVVSIYSRAFVDRYEASALTIEAMDAVRQVSSFAKASRIRKMGYLAFVCMTTAMDCTLGTVSRAIRGASDAVRDALSWELPAMEVDIFELPPYMLMSEVARGTDVPSSVAAVVAAEMSRTAAAGARGFGARWARAFSELTPARPGADAVRYRVEDVNLAQVAKAVGPAVEAALAVVRQEVELDEPTISRSQIDAAMVVRQIRSHTRVDYDPVADPVEVFNHLHSAAFAGVAEQELEHDMASISLDPQDRYLAAPRLVLPGHFGDAPAPREYYRSKVRALNVPKRQQTLQELLSAIASRNLNAPQVSLPQDEEAVVYDVWNVFLDHACVPDARKKLAVYASDPVSLSEDAFREWAEQSGPAKLEAVRKELEEASLSFAEMSVSDYLVMLKADVKPPLSVKPLSQRTEPQVIVYHRKALSSFFSSIFRVLVRRFLSLLRPEYHLNLLKDTQDVEAFIRAVHPYGTKGLKYLENDFSKYDKSQGRFVFLLEQYAFTQLGMNEEMLCKWAGGHIKCKMRAMAMALSLEVWYQRKSGDATTAFGNGMLNLMAVTYVYRATDVKWAVFMGDDSLVCSAGTVGDESAVSMLAEVFNLGAKMYVTSSPYFASNFVFIDDLAGDVALVADPVKRVERWSMSVSAADPQWHERYVSACDALKTYLDCARLAALPKALLERYGIPTDVTAGVGAAVATVLKSEASFRAMWEEEPEVSVY